MNLRYKIFLIVCILAGVFLWGRCSRRSHPGSELVPVLPKNETERIIIDPGRHRITIQTPQEIKTETLPNKPSVFDVNQNGTVKVSVSSFGFETQPFIGMVVSDQFRFIGGSDFFYFKRLDLGAGIGINRYGGSFTGIGKISYNIWSNVQLGVIYDTQRSVGLALTVRL